jgi:hypothetical protein
MSSILKVDQLQDSGGNAIITSDGSGNLTTQKILYPAFEAYLSADQSITEEVATKIQFNTENLDTDNCYDNSTNYRFTPNVAGKYFVYLQIRGDSGNSTKLDFQITTIFKNGTNLRSSITDFRNNYGRQTTCNVNAIVDMNGTTDYLEGFLQCNTQATTPKAESATQGCCFGAYRIGD